MKKTKFSENQIVQILKQAEVSVVDLCRQYGLGKSTFYKWRAKYGGLDVTLLRRLRALEQENARLKKMYANVQMDKEVLQEALSKKW